MSLHSAVLDITSATEYSADLTGLRFDALLHDGTCKGWVRVSSKGPKGDSDSLGTLDIHAERCQSDRPELATKIQFANRDNPDRIFRVHLCSQCIIDKCTTTSYKEGKALEEVKEGLKGGLDKLAEVLHSATSIDVSRRGLDFKVSEIGRSNFNLNFLAKELTLTLKLRAKAGEDPEQWYTLGAKIVSEGGTLRPRESDLSLDPLPSSGTLASLRTALAEEISQGLDSGLNHSVEALRILESKPDDPSQNATNAGIAFEVFSSEERFEKSVAQCFLDSGGGILYRGVLEPQDSLENPRLRLPLQPPTLDRLIRKAVGSNAVLTSFAGGAALRSKVGGDVFQASEELPEVTIEPHQEMSYQPSFPSLFFIYCDTPAACGGGESGVTDMRAVTRALEEMRFEGSGGSETVLARIRREGVRYQFVLYPNACGYYDWHHQIADTKERVEKILVEKRYEWEWMEGDVLRYWYVLPGVVMHPGTGEDLFFNQRVALHESYFWWHPDWQKCEVGLRPVGALCYLKRARVHGRDVSEEKQLPAFSTFWGKSGEALTADQVGFIRRVIWQNTKICAMQAGDLLCLDNYLYAHSRLSWSPGITRKLRVMLAREESF
uniref:TauD/TfdA-like domain-containing protein n=1 Tax=Chromera velia CCMP2878 TaxID=1169474 RepID=A0A0G4HWZ7_9ALVE|eukprot:Cvel_9177.t1-p1 / transcript=Cvel_9177.t1 / gene=Cvel_9177 / organism=Chromera_velia_CCMP2878 / gene_product=Clavaminate synthase-like protein At3g21360, putative / transcript_product=Clavaminate synthase-like protein At3g21360, putative / location=Cvel_scaffold522:76627-80460(-) / protein_length=605 / sequence_SO=supercontig / SO=protein_coding / is_pseudo=false